MGKLQLLKLLSLELFNRDGKLIYQEKNKPNLTHDLGEKFILDAAFTDASVIPENFYFGLDNRDSIAEDDVMADLIDEPSGNGYARQAVSSEGDFTVALNGSDVYQATSPIVTFSASGGDIGPVNHLFLATTNTGSGILISSVSFTSPLIINDGGSVNMRFGLTLTST